MSGDDPKHRRRGRPEPPSLDDEGPPEGAFFRAPTKAFQALPTEVLEVDSGPRPEEGGAGRGPPASRLPASLFEAPRSDAPGAFPTPPPTEALGAEEVRRLTRRHARIETSPAEDALERTNPEPFRVELDSEERALLEVAREPTHHDLYLDELDGPASETSTDVAPRPVSGLLNVGLSVTDDGFEDRTLALDQDELRAALPHAPSPLSEPTAEDAPLPSGPDSLELDPTSAHPVEALPPGATFHELRDVVGAARVFDPERHPHAITDPGFREDSEEWPEITLPPRPPPKPPPRERRRFPLALVAFLISALLVSAGGVGIGVSLSKRGVQLDDVLASVGLSDDAPSPPDRDHSDDFASEESKSVVDPAGAWRGRTVQIHFAKVSDASYAGAEGLAETLQKAFVSALESDEHAAWKVVSSRPQKGPGFALSLTVRSLAKREDGAFEVGCALEGNRVHEPGGEVKVAVSAARRAEGSLAGADSAKVAQEAARACGFGLALAFFGPALAEAP